jgi:hypothetical protein
MSPPGTKAYSPGMTQTLCARNNPQTGFSLNAIKDSRIFATTECPTNTFSSQEKRSRCQSSIAAFYISKVFLTDKSTLNQPSCVYKLNSF